MLLPTILLSLITLTTAQTQPLHEKFKAKGGPTKYIGTCSDRGLLNDGSPTASLIRQHFGQITPENSMKWDPINPNKGVYKFEPADYLVNWATNNSKLIRGHTTVWHHRLPKWVLGIRDKETLTNVVKVHVQTLVGRWKGRVHGWDVVNEFFADDGTVRKSVFSEVLGEEFVALAFRTAREADPKAKLYINDYDLDTPNHKKTIAIARRVREWRAKGIPIDGIGSQAHILPGQGAQTEAGLKVICAAAPECALTEVDVRDASPADYTGMVRGCLNVKNCVGLTIWGISDKDSWHAKENPLLFDRQFKPKPAFDALIKML